MIHSKNPLWRVLACALLTLLLSCSSAPKAKDGSHEIIPLVGSTQVHRFRFPNGLKLLVVEDHSSPTFAYQTWFNVGSRDEREKYTGLAHLFEHMMFKGTTKHPDGQYDRILESNGVEGENAFTNNDYTAYVQELPKDRLELIADLESDRMVNLIVDEKSFATEREVVQNERRMRMENSPDGLMYQELGELAFTKHSYHWPVIGYEEDLARMSAQDARDFYRAHYAPNHATIVVVGDVDAQEVRRVVEKRYGSFKPQMAPPNEIVAEPEQKSPRRKVLKLNTQVEKIMMGLRAPPVMHADIPALTLAATILAEGKSSRLSRALVDTGIMTSIGFYQIDARDPTLLIFAGSLQKGKKASQAEDIMIHEFNRFANQTIGQAELERAKNINSYAFYEGLSTANERARFLGQFETVTGDFQNALAIAKKVQAVTPAEIQRVARTYLTAPARTTILGVQK